MGNQVDNISKQPPAAQGLYDPAYEKDSCGVGFVANIHGEVSRRIVDMGLESLCKLEHRGSVGADPNTGDGSGIMLQIPDLFFQRVVTEMGIQLPRAGRYAIGFVYLPQKASTRQGIETLIEKVTLDEGQNFLGWRDVPIDPQALGEGARQTLPYMRQCFIAASDDIEDTFAFEQKLYLIRRVIDRRVRAEYQLDRSNYYVASFSCRTIVYKGMLTAEQLQDFYPDLKAADMYSALALLHQRYSTNTFPTWDLAQPFRMIAHNGEINTVRGNQNWMAARQMVMQSSVYGNDLRRMLPIIMEGQSDSATFDTVYELLHMTGRSLPHIMMMMIPEAWSKYQDMPPSLRSFYEYHAAIMEPWDGPAAIAFTDGQIIGATLDRNGLRPGRYIVTKDNLVIMASEAGTVNIPPQSIAVSGRLRPGHMFLIDTKAGRIIHDKDIKAEVANARPYGLWVEKNMVRLHKLPEPPFVHQPDHKMIRERQRIFSYTTEDLSMHMRPMAVNAQEPLASMGIDSALAVLSEQPVPLFHYFKQQFAQVTNPAIDPIREELVMELTTYIGPEENLLDETVGHTHCLELEHPVLTNTDIEKIRHISSGHFRSHTISILFDATHKHGMRHRLDQIKDEAAQAIHNGYNLLILSDRGANKTTAPIPSLLALSAVHHSLNNAGLRTRSGLIVESGEPRQVFHFALLFGYGANAVNPYLAFESLADMHKQGHLPELPDMQTACQNYIHAISKGLLKIFSKMGISTLQSYCGAHIFEAVGLDSELVNLYFGRTQTRIEGLSLEMLEEETLHRHRQAYESLGDQDQLLSVGFHHYRKYSIRHLLSPEVIYQLQHACRTNDYQLYQDYAQIINDQGEDPIQLRSLFKLIGQKRSLDVEEVEKEDAIIKRFSSGAMSFGSISWETHTDLAIAMNAIGAKSNTGEGGEDPVRFIPLENGQNMRSAIKQVASGRFGVTAHYLVNADDIQIKISQGAKPGEGGQLPGHKVDAYIAKLRFSTPGVSLISPPPHHDIYSIEDIKQLIFDLKNVNPKARISVKLVAQSGVGTVAAGVAKAHADHILISGYSGGTGASPLSSIHHAGIPWELGLSEAHQTLLIQGLRDRVYLGVDGKILTGKDVVIGALLGAEEFGFSAAPLITLGCIMMRKCHLNTCPVGIATQDKQLRSNYMGKPEYVINYMRFVAREVREIMAKLGFRRLDEMVGRVDKIKVEVPKKHWKARGLDFSRVLHSPQPAYGSQSFRCRDQEHALDLQLDQKLIAQAKPILRLEGRAKNNGSTPTSLQKIEIKIAVANTDRSVGAMLSGEVARIYGSGGLPDGTIHVEMEGIAGQSFGAFLAHGIDLHLWGQANDYVAKGLSGGRIVIRVAKQANYKAEENIIIGNTCVYGATSGEAYFQGMAGERFCVRNSGAYCVVEGVGDHSCEYMTGGRVVVLGPVGRNFAAGMSGGIAYVYDAHNSLALQLNRSMALIEEKGLSTDEYRQECWQMISHHYEYTKSQRARFILDNWQSEAKHFVSIIPRDYQQALSQQQPVALQSKEGTAPASLGIG